LPVTVGNPEPNLGWAMGKLYDTWQSPYPVDRFPAQLLAIVNRMDLAQPDAQKCQQETGAGDMRGAEIRFEYAMIPRDLGKDNLRLIVEFVLPCLSSTGGGFTDLAKDWIGLADSKLSMDDGTYQNALDALLRKWLARVQKTRLRIAGGGLGPWDVREYSFEASGLVRQNLEREVNFLFGKCVDASSTFGQWARLNASHINDSQYDLPAEVQALMATIDPDEPHVLTLGADPKQPFHDLDAVRQSLSINTCRGCHSSETKPAGGVHINQRVRGSASDLSGFLSGTTNCAISKDSNLISYCQVYPVVANCGAPRVSQFYNDLLRRDLYLDAVLHPTFAAGSPQWYASLSRYGATQVD